MSKPLENVQMNNLLTEIRERLEKAIAENKIEEATKEKPVSWSNELGEFKADGQHLYFKPKKPIESIKIEFKIQKK